MAQRRRWTPDIESSRNGGALDIRRTPGHIVHAVTAAGRDLQDQKEGAPQYYDQVWGAAVLPVITCRCVTMPAHPAHSTASP